MLCKVDGVIFVSLSVYVKLLGRSLPLYWFLRRTTRNFKLLAGTNMGAYLNSRS